MMPAGAVERNGGARSRTGRTSPRPAAGGRFLRFCGAGGLGFLVDAGALMALIHILGVGPIPARPIAAVVAILTTFELNRRWAFRGTGLGRYWPALAAYAGVQSLGLACNVAVYTGCTLLLPAPFNAPLPSLVAASALALLINYAGASRVAFRTTAG